MSMIFFGYSLWLDWVDGKAEEVEREAYGDIEPWMSRHYTLTMCHESGHECFYCKD